MDTKMAAILELDVFGLTVLCEMKWNEMVLCEMVLCEMVLCKMGLCEWYFAKRYHR